MSLTVFILFAAGALVAADGPYPADDLSLEGSEDVEMLLRRQALDAVRHLRHLVQLRQQQT